MYEPLETIFKQEIGDGCKRQIFVLTDGHVSLPGVSRNYKLMPQTMVKFTPRIINERIKTMVKFIYGTCQPTKHQGYPTLTKLTVTYINGCGVCHKQVCKLFV